MLYGLGSVGSFAQGAQRRQKEIRNERAQIREEFERWRQNNPYASAAEFHAKVRQLGSTTPGGSVALPDAHAIQQMAAENQRRKQAEEDERAMTQRIRSMQLQEATVSMLGNAFTNDPNANYTDVLKSLGMEVNEANVALAQRAQTGVQTANQKAAEAEEQRQLEMIFDHALRLSGDKFDYMTWPEKVDYTANLFQFEPPRNIGQGPDGIYAGQAAATPQPTPAPQPDVMEPPRVTVAPPSVQQTATVPQPAAPMNSQGVALISTRLTTDLPDQLRGVELTPQSLDLAIASLRGSMLTGTPRTEAEFEAALAGNELVQQLRTQALTNQFTKLLTAPRDVEELHGKMESANVPLKTFLETAANLNGNLANLYIPPNREAELADLLLGMLSLDRDGNPVWNKKYDGLSSVELQDAVNKELELYGFTTQDQIRANRDLALSYGTEVDTFEEVKALFDRNMLVDEDGTTAEQAIMAGEDMTERENRQKENIELLQYYKAVAMNGSSVDRYSLNMFDPADILSPEEQQRYAAEIEAYFNERITKLQELDLTKGTMSDKDIRNQSRDERNNEIEAEEKALIQDAATTAMSRPITQNEREAMLSTLRQQGYANQFDNLSIVRVEDGEAELVNPFETGDLFGLLQGDQGQVVAQAIKASLAAYEGLELMASNRGNVLSAVGGFVHNRFTEENQRVAAGLNAAKAVLKANGIEDVTPYMNLITKQVLRGEGISGVPNRVVMARALAEMAPAEYEAIITK